MLADITGVENIYIICGYTDMRKSIDGLCAILLDNVKRFGNKIALVWVFIGCLG